MKSEYNAEEMAMTAEQRTSMHIDIPENATAKQISEFHKTVAGIVVDPMELVAKAFEDIFNEPFDDGTEDPNEQQTGELT